MDFPTSWRTKMAFAVEVDKGITWQGGRGYGGHWTAWSKHRLSKGGAHLTRPKFRPYITGNPVGNKNLWRAAGRQTGKIYE